jgi:hypothetical protein
LRRRFCAAEAARASLPELQATNLTTLCLNLVSGVFRAGKIFFARRGF